LEQELRVGTGKAQPEDFSLRPDEVTAGELSQDQVTGIGLEPQPAEQCRLEGLVAQADAEATQPRGFERLAENRQDFRRALWPRRADQLDPGLQELA